MAAILKNQHDVITPSRWFDFDAMWQADAKWHTDEDK